MGRFWTSDWHLNHGNIIEFVPRPFWKAASFFEGETPGIDGVPRATEVPDTDAMNKTLIDNFNDMVGVGDEAWFVGDVAMGKRSESLPLFKQLKCRNLFLVPGNHDNCHKMHGKYEKHIPAYEDAGFKIMDSQETVTIAGEEVLVCHFPYWGDSHFDDRYSGLRPNDEGRWLIHGHTHSPDVLRERQIHVGVDAWAYRPVSDETIAGVISGG